MSKIETIILKGIELGRLGKYDEVIKCCDKVIEIDPNHAEAWCNKGTALGNLGKYDEEIKCYDKAIKINPNLAEAWYNKGTSLGRLGKHDEAIKCCDKAIEINPNYANAWYNKGVSLGYLGKHDEAIKCCDKAIEINPNYANAWYNKGISLGYLRKYDEAIKCYNESIKIEIHFAETYSNKELTLLNLHKYDVAKTLGIEKEPKIERIFIADTEKDCLRVCIVQLDFSLAENFPYILKENKTKVRKRMFEALKIAEKENVDIVCFPELSFAKEWVDEIKNSYKNMMIVCGSYYDERNRNLCQIIIDGKDYSYAKCHYSLMEKPNGEGLKKGDKLFLFQTRYGIISVLTCVDFDLEHTRIINYVKKKINKPLNLIINPRFDIDNEYHFQQLSNVTIDRSDGSRSPTCFLHINAKKVEWANKKGGGGTTIVCSEHIYRIEKFKGDGLRPKDGAKYKICQAKDEMMLIADLNIKKIENRIEMSNCNWYINKNEQWTSLNNKRIWS